jgi:hypothetical protein
VPIYVERCIFDAGLVSVLKLVDIISNAKDSEPYMENIFNVIEPGAISSMFDNEDKCLEFLAGEKWRSGFVCRHCGHSNYCKGKKPFSRRCTRCKREESATAHTIFHGCKIPLTDAFKMAYSVCQSPDISTYNLSRLFDIRQMTCWKFKKKIMECIEKKGQLEIIG